MLYLSGQRYENPRMMDLSGLNFYADGLGETYGLILDDDGSVIGFAPQSDPEQVWTRVEEQ